MTENLDDGLFKKPHVLETRKIKHKTHKRQRSFVNVASMREKEEGVNNNNQFNVDDFFSKLEGSFE
jgi:hypothetical protein